MKNIIRKLLLGLAFVLMLSGNAFAGENFLTYVSNLRLVSFFNTLSEGLFSGSFSFEDTYLRDAPDMCEGELLIGCRVTSEFGWRKNPVYRRAQFHSGIDLAAPRGTFIVAPADGIVKKGGWSLGYGRKIEIDHGYAWTTTYAHLKKIYVMAGQHVRKGDIIGEVGSSGLSTGPHLHFEMTYFNTRVNPKDYFASLRYTSSPSIETASR